MIKQSKPLVLASGSPRRKEILSTMGLSYTVDVSEVDETFEGMPQDAVRELSRRKAAAVAARHDCSIVLAADTLVYTDQVLGKPESEEQAKEMLKSLSGKWHSVFTGMTLIDTSAERMIQRVCETRVHFAEMTEEEIAAYVRSKEPMDKAGSYGIQGMGGMFIDRIEGSYSNVVGLPMCELREMLSELNCDNE